MTERDKIMAEITILKSDETEEVSQDSGNNPSDRVERAMAMAKEYHSGQMRRGSGGIVPYYDEHILGVYHILRDECGIDDEDVLVIALLHDTVEDTACTLDDIESVFGTDIREQVRLLTRVDGEPFSVYSRRLFSQGSYRVILVKLADRLHNLRTIIYMPDARWIKKKVKQSYTDILNPLPDALKRIDGRYNDVIHVLADKIEDQILAVQQELNLRHS